MASTQTVQKSCLRCRPDNETRNRAPQTCRVRTDFKTAFKIFPISTINPRGVPTIWNILRHLNVQDLSVSSININLTSAQHHHQLCWAFPRDPETTDRQTDRSSLWDSADLELSKLDQRWMRLCNYQGSTAAVCLDKTNKQINKWQNMQSREGETGIVN